MKKLFAFLLCVAMLLTLAACGNSSETTLSTNPSDYVDKASEDATHIATIEMKDGGVIVLELYGNIAPISVKNFAELAEEGFYDGIIFHRVIENFMIQAGDPTGTGMSGSDKEIKGEFSANGVENNLSHERGVISMARKSTGYDTASSQFFICHQDCESLDGQYAAFGRVIEGMETVDAIATVETDSNDKPLEDQVIKTIKITEV